MFIRQLEYLAALDRERHFGRAAAACHAAQPTLSAGIRSLERELGVPLVRRGREFEALTPEGELILGWAQRALADITSLQQEASRLRGGLEGTLRIGAIPTSLPRSPLVTARFRERHPRMRVRLTSMSSRQIAHGLEHGEIEAGLTYLDNEPLAHVDAVPLWRERYLLVTPAGEDFGELGHVGGRGVVAALPADARHAAPPDRRRRVRVGQRGAEPGGRDQLRLDPDRPRSRRPARHHRRHLARRQPAARRPARDPARGARRSSTRSGSSPPRRSSARR